METVSESGETHTFRTTDDHPWWVEGHGWKRTDELSSKDILATQTGLRVSVLSVINTKRIEPTFNFEVADFNTYFVGESKIWVHNACSVNRRGKNFTSAQRRDFKAANAEANGGNMTCTDCKRDNLQNIGNVKGQKTPDNQAQVHHNPAIKDGGGRDSDGEVLCPKCHVERHRNEK